MCRTLCLTLALVVLSIASAVAQPDVTTVSGTIQKVDPNADRFTLRSAAGTITELRVPAALLKNMQSGEVVEVMMAGPNAMVIRKQASTPPSEESQVP